MSGLKIFILQQIDKQDQHDTAYARRDQTLP